MAFPTQVDRLATRTGLPPELVAILLIVAGVLVLVMPEIIAYIVGILLIVLGVWWLVASFQARQHAERRGQPPTAPPP